MLGYSTVQAGALLIPMSAVMMVLAPMSTRWVHILGNKIVVAAGMGVLAVTLLLMTTFDAGSGWLHVMLVTVGLGIGMANIMAPATESIMGSLPRAKAGVGSAMNDTTRQVGGAIGVAVLGSILSSRYLGSYIQDMASGTFIRATDAGENDTRTPTSVSRGPAVPIDVVSADLAARLRLSASAEIMEPGLRPSAAPVATCRVGRPRSQEPRGGDPAYLR